MRILCLYGMFSNPYFKKCMALPAPISTYALSMHHIVRDMSHGNSLISRPCSVAMDLKPMQGIPNVDVLGFLEDSIGAMHLITVALMTRSFTEFEEIKKVEL